MFAIYVTLLVTRWLMRDIGGLAQMNQINQQKAALLYQTLDQSEGFYLGRAAARDRSLMNVAFNLRDPDLEQQFLAQALAAGFSGLPGHRALGGIRASIYNALSLSAVQTLTDFMRDFQHQSSH